jgi:hypothetical protein
MSGGQQQRVALARAVAIQPGVLLLDEPLSAVDAKVREELRTEIRRMQVQLHITTILVTHDQSEALSISDRVVVMNRGAIEEVGTPTQIYAEPRRRSRRVHRSDERDPGSRRVGQRRGGRARRQAGSRLRGRPAADGELGLLLVRPESLEPLGPSSASLNGDLTLTGRVEVQTFPRGDDPASPARVAATADGRSAPASTRLLAVDVPSSPAPAAGRPAASSTVRIPVGGQPRHRRSIGRGQAASPAKLPPENSHGEEPSEPTAVRDARPFLARQPAHPLDTLRRSPEPAETVAWYRDNGYDFVALTDHFVQRFGYPITTPGDADRRLHDAHRGGAARSRGPQVGNLWHIVAAGVPLDFAPPAPGETGPQLAARAAANGAFVIVAHPAYYGLTRRPTWSDGAAHAMEIFNGASELAYEMGDSSHILDVLMSRGRRIDACATDDAHFEHRVSGLPGPRSGLGGGQGRGERPGRDGRRSRAGHFYASEGPKLLDVAIDGDDVVVASSPVMKVIVSGGGERYECRYGDRADRDQRPAHDVPQRRFEVDPFLGSYVRITVVDANGKRAWTNPIWLG